MKPSLIDASGVQFVRDHLAHFPRPDRAGADALRSWASGQGVELDPDQVDVVTFHYQAAPKGGWRGVVTARQSLSSALLSDWQGESNRNYLGALLGEPWAGHMPGPINIVAGLEQPGAAWNATGYSVFNGVFRRSEPQVYDQTTHIPVSAQALQTFIWGLDFHAVYQQMLDDYWHAHEANYRLCAKLNFIAACNKQAAEGSLNRAAVALAWQAAGVAKADTAIEARRLNVYGYSSDVVYITRVGEPHVLLYLPGNASPLHAFSSAAQLQAWFAEQCKDGAKRQALLEHFAVADRADGLSYSGVATALDGLAAYPDINHLDSNRPGFTTEGHWDPAHYINYKPEVYSAPIHGDLFTALTQHYRERSYSDADQVIIRNSEVSKARWVGYLHSAMNLLAPLALVVPELAIIYAVGGVAQFGLGLDQALHGKQLEQRADGVSDTVFGLFNALPLVHQLAQGPSLLFSLKNERFVAPQAINGRVGYPLSPIYPPVLPEALEVAPYFRAPESIAALPGGNPQVAATIRRTPTFDGAIDNLTGVIHGWQEDLVYDIELDAFIKPEDLNEVAPPYYTGPASGNDLVEIEPQARPVTDPMRMNTLRALGVDVALPVELPATPAPGTLPIPKQVLSIWVGDQVLSTGLLKNIGKNAALLNGSPYEFRLYLSRATPSAFEQNQQLLAVHAPSLRVLPLEDQAFYKTFEQSANFSHYQTAIAGNGGVASNFASASDVLRYALLKSEGGVYMDVDDTLIDGAGRGLSGATLSHVELLTTREGLLLYRPVSNEKLSMAHLFNNSLVASHANNPTLDALLEEMNLRFQQKPAFYDSKPTLLQDPRAFYEYARTLSWLTGPRLLNDVIARQLPELYQLQQLYGLFTFPTRGLEQLLDKAALSKVLSQWMPFELYAEIGGGQSWAAR